MANQTKPNVTKRLRPKPPIKKPYYTEEQVADALQANRGRLVQTANMLDVATGTLLRYCRKYPRLETLRQTLKLARFDQAMAVVEGAVDEGNLGAAYFTAKQTIERERIRSEADRPVISVEIKLDPKYAFYV